MNTTYDPSKESEIYKAWEDSGFFNPDRAPKKPRKAPPRSKPRKISSRGKQKVFSMVLPPPNVTGILHMGHAAMLAIQDILIRYHRMKGDKTLWIPGTDHAAIATQEKVEKEIYKKEGKSRHDLGREEFLRRVEQFAKESHDHIVRQTKRMGASLDWSREAFTLDEARTRAVREAFKRMYGAGLIYRGGRIVNWDPKLQTTVSDDEIEWKEEKASFYYFKYGPFEIGTARPETKFGDKYVVMHPKDGRYAKWKDGQKVELEWINGPITATIIKDGAVDPAFGTGVMTITPWHDATDFEIAERHKLDKEQIIDLRGKLLPIAGEFAGKKITEARPLVVEKLKAKGLLVKTDENYTHRIATSSRGGGTIEPQILTQWFVDVSKKFTLQKPLKGSGLKEIKGINPRNEISLKELMYMAVRSGQITILPKKFNKIYFYWTDNLRDWCISRQIWYGHRIPAWYHESKCIPRQGHEADVAKCKEVIVSDVKPKCEFCNAEFTQDPDTLDTWFSSGLWTFSTLGWPFGKAQGKPFDSAPFDKAQGGHGKPSKDFLMYHPTSVLETGYDILFFWVARMILMSGFLLGDIPFKTVYLHGMVRDAQGRKMSKSLGNIIDPLVMAEKYGADATRLSLIIGAAPGNDMKLSEDRVRGYRNFSTKLWNIARFIRMNEKPEFASLRSRYTAEDKKALVKALSIQKRVERSINTFRFHEGAELLYHYVWHELADKIIEREKKRLQGEHMAHAGTAHALLRELLRISITALHPFMPFVTEAIYQELYASEAKGDLLMIQNW
jgi:valyl-tRNA synthetase